MLYHDAMGLFDRKKLSSEQSLDPPQPLPKGLYLISNKRTMVGDSPATTGPGVFPRYAYWETPDEVADSGWRVFTGLETQSDADDSTNFQVNAVETLIIHHPALAQILRQGVRGAWEWNDDLGIYVQIES
jgi:hypothetical protein